MFRHWAISVVQMMPMVLVAMLSTGCQTSMVRQFEEVKPGMEKAQVLALMGSPNQTQRSHGKDRWFYNFYESKIRFQKEVQFFEGNAIYVGEVWQAPVSQSAAAADAKNAQQDKLIDEQIAKDIETHRRDYEGYEAKTKGEDKVRYVPQFEPIR
ncbi:outer membrane protein assembly factor BamE domain-containing protein [Bdellovibrio svalbardensis]|uniref:Outer membrane protein assembly factor BamE n=1 Tax=Bdellovibrio svalbardensis TaxID=2972972 RepID=A0ABT6DK87_9BACT|nr:outer membrane protein assembly factor BamE [Bdellovibrio svalbardensis]MDG0817275.1 outer membrane protein assembly factor BamE [Bdellovibrio svalbardensis]